jgi:hypothetical protein
MESTLTFPRKVAVRVRPAREGLAINLCFEASKKNNFHYTLFVDRDGCAEVSGAELLRTFDEDRSMFIMDYEDPRLTFTGRVTANVLNTSELHRSLGAFEIYRGKCEFPEGYEDKLRLAAARGQDPNQFRVDVIVDDDSHAGAESVDAES